MFGSLVKKARDAIARLKIKFGAEPPHIKLGRLGEDLAVNLLSSEGYVILERNIKVSGREVDVIAVDGNLLVVVEVKTRSGKSFGPPLLAVDMKRRERLRQAGAIYMLSKKLKSSSIRFDVVTVDFAEGKEPKIELLKNAF